MRQLLKNVRKGEIAHIEQFPPFPQCFLLNQIIVSPFFRVFDIISFSATEFEEPKLDKSGRGLTLSQTERICRRQLSLMKLAESSSNG